MKKRDLFNRAEGDRRGGEQGPTEGHAVTHSDYSLIFVDFLSLSLTGIPTPSHPLPGLSSLHSAYCTCGTSRVPSEERDWHSFLGLRHLESYPAHS